MTTSETNPIAAYRESNDLTIQALADALDISKGHACDLVNGKERVGMKVAQRMAALTGRPWHEFMQPPEAA